MKKTYLNPMFYLIEVDADIDTIRVSEAYGSSDIIDLDDLLNLS